MSGVVRLVARREITSRVQQKSYRIGLLVALLIAVIAVLLPAFFRGGHAAKSYDVAVTGAEPNLPAALRAAGRAEGVRIVVHPASVAEARAGVRSGRWDAAVLPDQSIVARHRTDGAVAIAQAGYALARTVDRLAGQGLTTEQALTALRPHRLPVSETSSALNAQRQTVAIVTVLVLFSQLITFCTWVGMGVVEEKSSRVVELLLSSVRPVQLLVGKLLGIGALAAAQVAVLGGAALITATTAGTLTLPATELLTVLISFAAFLLGYAFFAAVAAGLASTVSRQEEVSGVLAPVTVSLTLCYFAAFTVASDSGSGFARVISLVPPVSAIAMPARISRGGVPISDVVIAIALLALVTAGVLVLAGRIYRASILHTGSRLKLRQAWRSEPVATPQ